MNSPFKSCRKRAAERLRLWVIPGFLICLVNFAFADQSGDFTYNIIGTSVSITGYSVTGPNNVVIPATLASKPVTRIGSNAFAGRSQLTSVTIPSSVTLIDDTAFSDCHGLTSLAIPSSVTAIGNSAFRNCDGLTGLTLLPGLKYIGAYAFSYCDLLASVTLPAGLTTIGSNAFSGVVLTTVMIPSSVTSIGSSAFGPCDRLKSIVVDPANFYYSSANGVLLNQSKSLLIQYPIGVSGDYEIPPSVTTIGADAFYGASELTGVAIPTSVTNIGDRAFSFCRYQLGSVTIPPSVTRIGVRAFANSALTGVVIPASVTTIGASAFSFCSNMKFISVDAGNLNYSSNNGVLFNKGQTVLIQCPAGTSGAYQVPTGVTGIGGDAFFGCAKLTGVVIPSGVVSIGDYAFGSCSNLISAAFVGNAPAMGTGVFQNTAYGFKIYYLNGATGFTAPAVNFGDLTAVGSWLLSQGFSYTSSLKEDSNGDGVNLLLAYALNLDPNQNLGASLPRPVFATDQISLSFYAGREGVTYTAEASADMKVWSTDGVTISAPDANQIRTAFVNGGGPRRFMRLSACQQD